MKRRLLLAFVVTSLLGFTLTGCKDDVVLPFVSGTTEVTDITETTATSGGDILVSYKAAITERGICWSVRENPTINDSVARVKVGSELGIGYFTCMMKNLIPNTTYYVRAFAVNSDGVGYGNIVSFKTNKRVVLSDYVGVWHGTELGTRTITTGSVSSKDSIKNVVTSISVSKLLESILLINGDTATVVGAKLNFKTQTLYDSNLGLNLTETKTGMLKDNKIEIYTTSLGSYSISGVNVSVVSESTLVLVK